MTSDAAGQIAIFIMREALVKNGSGGLGNQDAMLLNPQSVLVPHFFTRNGNQAILLGLRLCTDVVTWPLPEACLTIIESKIDVPADTT